MRDDTATTTELTDDNGAVALSNLFDYDELILLPFFISETHAVEMYGWVSAGNPFTVRRLTMKGDILVSTSRSETVIGEVDGQQYLQGNRNATWMNNLRTVFPNFLFQFVYRCQCLCRTDTSRRSYRRRSLSVSLLDDEFLNQASPLLV